MKWIGLVLLILGALLALDNRNWFVPTGLGAFLLGYWYFVERPSNETPPDKSDYLHHNEESQELHESSTSFDLPDLKPFLQRLLPHVTGGYTQDIIDHLTQLSEHMKHEDERSLDYEVIYQGNRIPLKIGLFKDDLNEVTVYFHTTKSLSDFIDSEMETFFAERGM
jgi:hypothetical protein